jgi:hypothetical protein
LLKRRTLHFIRSCGGQPHDRIAALAFCFAFWFTIATMIFASLVRRTFGWRALLMLGGSLLKGFWHRGLVFEPPDVEFLFTSPFSQRQIFLYRLLSGYLFAVVQGLVFLALFEPHLKHPWLASLCLVLFQIACFHLATGAAIFAGTISQQSHHRVRWMILGLYFLITALYMRAAWDSNSFVVVSPVYSNSLLPALALSTHCEPSIVVDITLVLSIDLCDSSLHYLALEAAAWRCCCGSNPAF